MKNLISLCFIYLAEDPTLNVWLAGLLYIRTFSPNHSNFAQIIMKTKKKIFYFFRVIAFGKFGH